MFQAGGKLDRPPSQGRRRRKALAGFPLLCLLALGAWSVALLATGTAAAAGTAAGPEKEQHRRSRLPANFFGISPNRGLPTAAEFARMQRGGIRTYRIPLGWSQAWPSPGVLNWASFDAQVAGAAAAGLSVLPVTYSTPSWLGVSPLTLPVGSAWQRGVWQAFLTLAVERYGPGGDFWTANPGLPYRPIRAWQIWNEENATWYTEPVSVTGYAQLLKISSKALKAVDPGATVVTGGLYGRPNLPKTLTASNFLKRLYRVKGVKASFDAVGLHPYAHDLREMRSLIDGIRSIIKGAGDPATPIWLDEFGWGSGTGGTSYDRGLQGQKKMLVAAYKTLIANQRRWRIGRTYWFSWEDVLPPACFYCTHSGLFTVSDVPKPAWYGFLQISRGRP